MPNSHRPSPPLPTDLEIEAVFSAVAGVGFPAHAPALRAVAALAAQRAVDRACDAVVPLVRAAKAAGGDEDGSALGDAVALVEGLVTGPVRVDYAPKV
jgi:hypothetical protein